MAHTKTSKTKTRRSILKEQGYTQHNPRSGVMTKGAHFKFVSTKNAIMADEPKTVPQPPYTITVDYGRPYNVIAQTEKDLKKELKKLRRIRDAQDHPYFDVIIRDSQDKDVTDKKIR